MFNWLSENNLLANRDIFQFIPFINDVLCNAVNMDNIILNPLGYIQLLGILHIGSELNFNGHDTTTICRKEGCQLIVLGRLANVLIIDDKNILFECFIISQFLPSCVSTVVVWQIFKNLKVFRREPFAIFIMTKFLLMRKR